MSEVIETFIPAAAPMIHCMDGTGEYVRTVDYCKRIAALEAEVAEARRDAGWLREALEWIARVNACDYEYQRKARQALWAGLGVEK